MEGVQDRSIAHAEMYFEDGRSAWWAEPTILEPVGEKVLLSDHGSPSVAAHSSVGSVRPLTGFSSREIC